MQKYSFHIKIFCEAWWWACIKWDFTPERVRLPVKGMERSFIHSFVLRIIIISLLKPNMNLIFEQKTFAPSLIQFSLKKISEPPFLSCYQTFPSDNSQYFLSSYFSNSHNNRYSVRSKTKSCFEDSRTKSIIMVEKRPFEKNEDPF